MVARSDKHSRLRYSCCNKEVLQDGQHFADACDETAAKLICAAMNFADVAASKKSR